MTQIMKDSHAKWWALGLLWVAFFLQQGTHPLVSPSLPSILDLEQRA